MSITPHSSLELLPGSPVLVIMLQGFKIPACSSVLCNIILYNGVRIPLKGPGVTGFPFNSAIVYGAQEQGTEMLREVQLCGKSSPALGTKSNR